MVFSPSWFTCVPSQAHVLSWPLLGSSGPVTVELNCAVGCDFVNNAMECSDGSPDRSGIKCEPLLCVTACPRAGCGLVDRRPRCCWKSDVKCECVCWLFLCLVKKLSMNTLLGNPSIFSRVPLKRGPPASRLLPISNTSSAWFLIARPSSLFFLVCWSFQKKRGIKGSDACASANLTNSSISSPGTSRVFFKSRLFFPPKSWGHLP